MASSDERTTLPPSLQISDSNADTAQPSQDPPPQAPQPTEGTLGVLLDTETYLNCLKRHMQAIVDGEPESAIACDVLLDEVNFYRGELIDAVLWVTNELLRPAQLRLEGLQPELQRAQRDMLMARGLNLDGYIGPAVEVFPNQADEEQLNAWERVALKAAVVQLSTLVRETRADVVKTVEDIREFRRMLDDWWFIY
ncbi:hypothetical protein LTR66_006092 [Elasticomyces elasticus]|nr:hypothetical protein LTR28_013117 [Elasticomyces elasticus]KAK4993087.1 hypothetical protein LTR66_006092 [Elasticomyces elasticus]